MVLEKHAIHPDSDFPNPTYKIDISNVTYSQIAAIKFGDGRYDPKKNGVNRDFSVAKYLSNHFAIICVCDGAALRYWSQVAATIFAIRFVEIIESKLREYGQGLEDKSIPIEELKVILKTALLEANNRVLVEKDLNNDNTEIDLRGGQTTVVATLIYRLIPKQSILHRLASKLSNKEEFGMCTISMGDSACSIVTLETQKANHMARFSNYLFSSPTPVPTPTTTIWNTITKNVGMMLPEISLHMGQITEPISEEIIPDQQLICCYSDGIIDSFVDVKGYPDLHQIDDGCAWSYANHILDQAQESHRDNKTAPDDVSLIVACFTKSPPSPSSSSSSSPPSSDQDQQDYNDNSIEYMKFTKEMEMIFPRDFTKKYYKGFKRVDLEFLGCTLSYGCTPSDNLSANASIHNSGYINSNNSNNNDTHECPQCDYEKNLTGDCNRCNIRMGQNNDNADVTHIQDTYGQEGEGGTQPEDF